ncbi:MAG: hypothetical protein O8C66_12575 [Candidatus Methanoperedens sp.]|nr:hypothetical protein [Candidatus Methanoperedens sp.]MCZ7371334.1 hypothetical protein [Candidatus Methanoperedens sp.]
MTRIGRIFTDIFNPCASVSSVASVFHPECNEPQMNTDERRYPTATDFSKIIHRKERKERKAARQESLRPLRSPWLNASSAPAPGRAPQPAFHPRLSRAGGWRAGG